MAVQFPQGIQVFGSRYLLQWTEEGAVKAGAALNITVARKGLKVVTQTER